MQENPVNISQIVISKFRELSYVELNLSKYVSINGKGQCIEGENK